MIIKPHGSENIEEVWVGKKVMWYVEWLIEKSP